MTVAHPIALLAAELARRLPDAVSLDAPGGAVTTYRCGGAFAIAVRADRRGDLPAIAGALAATEPEVPVPVLVVGRGSNLLVADAGFPGVAVVLGGEFDWSSPDPAMHRVRGGGATALPVLARRAAASGWAGLEFYVGIPGSVGGAVRMNAGGHGAQTADVLLDAEVFDLDRGEFSTVEVADLGLGYRTSALTDRLVVTGAAFAVTADDPDECGRRIDEIVRWRREHQPGGQNAGSVFTNPEGDAAGRLIEAAGCKGLRIGGAVVSEKHANFFVADAGARAADVHALVCEVRRRVADATGVRLETELRFVGFGPNPEAPA